MNENETSNISHLQCDAPPAHVQDPTSEENFIAATTCFLISFLGLLMNGWVSIFLLRLKALKNQFAYLCISLAIADCSVLAVFAFWTVPMTFTQNSQLSTGFIGKKFGHASLFFWFASLYSTLAIAVNRLLAISYPMAYKIWFSTKNTMKIMCACWMLALVHQTVYFFDECDFFYLPSLYIWMYAETECGAWIGFLLDFAYGIVFIVLIFILNLMTAMKLRRANKAVVPNGTASQNQQREEEVEKRRKQEVRFFLQACINAVIFELMLISFHGFSRLGTEKWGWFFTTTFIWQISHASNGFIMFFFNPPLRKGMAMTCCCIEEDGNVTKTKRTHVPYTNVRSKFQNSKPGIEGETGEPGRMKTINVTPAAGGNEVNAAIQVHHA